MNLTIRGVNYQPSDETRDFIDKKLKKLSFADDYLHDLEIAITRESKGRRRWGFDGPSLPGPLSGGPFVFPYFTRFVCSIIAL